MHEEPVAVGSAGREPAPNASVPHAQPTADLRGPTELVAYVDARWNLECERWDRDLPSDHPEDVLAKAGRAGHVFGRG